MNNPELLPLLRQLVANLCEPYIAMPETRGVLSIGSVSYEIVDEYSDIDIAIYYDELPSEQAFTDAMRQNGADALNWCLGDRKDGGIVESYYVHGVECQFAHTTLAAMESDMDSVLVDLDVASPFQKALSGVLAGQTIYGESLIDQYKKRAAEYPDALREAMVTKFFAFQPWWAIETRLSVRDAGLWRMHALVEGAQNLLGTLAGVNRLYYSTFQFKRMASFIDHMTIKPDDLANRLTVVFEGGPLAAATFRELVSETADIVEAEIPTANTTAVRRGLARTEHRWDASILDNALG